MLRAIQCCPVAPHPPSQYSTTNYTLVHVAYVASYSATVEVSSYGKKTDDQDLEFKKTSTVAINYFTRATFTQSPSIVITVTSEVASVGYQVSQSWSSSSSSLLSMTSKSSIFLGWTTIHREKYLQACYCKVQSVSSLQQTSAGQLTYYHICYSDAFSKNLFFPKTESPKCNSNQCSGYITWLCQGDTPPPTPTQPHKQEAERLQKRCFWKPGPFLNHLMFFLGTPSLNRTRAILPLGLSVFVSLSLRLSERKVNKKTCFFVVFFYGRHYQC